MTIRQHEKGNKQIAELISTEILLSNADEAVDIIGNMSYQGYEILVIHEKNIHPDFFELKSGIAGEVLQKFVNYQMRLFLIGDFEKYQSKSLSDFIFESNKGRQVKFQKDIESALEKI